MASSFSRTFSARNVVASTLLGTLPPRLSGHLLVAFAEEFGISAGTTRVALTRMVERGELRRDDGVYELCGPLLERQIRQEAGLAPTMVPWSGAWEIHVVRPGSRGSGERAALRRAARHLALRERRDGVWMRPDNLDPARFPEDRAVIAAQADRFIGLPDGEPAMLVAALFDLDDWATTAGRLSEKMIAMIALLEEGDRAPLAPGFELAAAALRHLVADPLLPEGLCPPAWPAAPLRHAYRSYDTAYRNRLSAFFRSRSRLKT